MKRTCSGCRAYDSTLGCTLGYKSEPVYGSGKLSWVRLGAKPLEKCPKPMTYNKWMEHWDERRR